MKWLISSAIRLRLPIVVLTAILIVGGMQKLRETPLDVFPEFSPPRVEIQTEVPGLSTADVESLVTVPIENALNGVPWVEKIRSKTVVGLSSVVLYFARKTDLIKARQLVQERLALVTTMLPGSAKPPVILPPTSSTSRLLKIGVSSKKLSQIDLTTIAKWSIRPRLMAISGVANVAIWGQRDRQLQVQVNPEQLQLNGVTLDEVITAVSSAASVAAGGYVDTPNQRLNVSCTVSVSTPAELEDIVVADHHGAMIRIKDVATVVEGAPQPIGNAIINDGPGLLLIVEKQPWGNSLEITHQIEAALDALRPGLKDIDIDSTIFRPATFIEMSLANLNHALLTGCILVTIVLIVFLFDWRTALISVFAIPTSLIAAALVLCYRGETVNTMVLAGLIIALGEVVDDAIIDVENVMRRLRLNYRNGSPRSTFNVVVDASLEVRSSVVYGSMIVVIVLIPVFMLEGLSGAFFRPLALSYVLAITASLAVALTLTPALAYMLLPGAASRRDADSPAVALLKFSYRHILPMFLKARALVVIGLLVAIGVTIVSIPRLGEEYLPNFCEFDFLMHWVEKPGTSIEAMDRITIRASKDLRSIQGVRNFGAHIARAEVADEVVGSHFTELWISLDPAVDYDATVARIQSTVDAYPGLYRDVLTYLRERIKEVLTGTSATIVIRTYGPNLDVLREKAGDIAAAIKDVAGVVDLKIQPQIQVPQIEIRIRNADAARFGITPDAIRQAVTAVINGVKVGEVYEDQRNVDVTVWSEPEFRSSVESLQDIRIATNSGAAIPLRDVATIAIVPTPNEITRESASRRIDVSCNVQDRDLGSIDREIRGRIAQLTFAHGYYPEILGEYTALQAARNRLGILAATSVIGIFLILHTDFRSVRLALLILMSLPFCLIGGVAGVFATGGILSLGSLIGFVTVIGIAVRNGILLLGHFRHLQVREGMPWGVDLILRGAEERLAPILMTALTTGMALLPLILGGIKPGHEIEHPMAIVIIGGLITSTMLNLFILPVLYFSFGRLPDCDDAVTIQVAAETGDAPVVHQ